MLTTIWRRCPGEWRASPERAAGGPLGGGREARAGLHGDGATRAQRPAGGAQCLARRDGEGGGRGRAGLAPRARAPPALAGGDVGSHKRRPGSCSPTSPEAETRAILPRYPRALFRSVPDGLHSE